ncbi:MAG: hypothetical protein HZC45_03290, partial [Deltaproteobacteria bacterium]|nr:hypothetical protein [Deltaproteobacteria bacterium]
VRRDGGQWTSRIELSTQNMDEGTPYHEAFHSAQKFLLTDEEIARIDARYPDKDGVSSKERQAQAFADYVKGRRNMPVWVRQIFERIKIFLEKLGNYLRGKGWTSVNDIFERTYTGELKQRYERGGDLGLDVDLEIEDNVASLDVEESKGRINITGKELGSYNTLNELRDKAREYARNNFAGVTVRNADKEMNVIISWQGIKHALSGTIDENKILSVAVIPDMVRQAKWVTSEPDYRNRNTIKAIHKFEAPVNIKGIANRATLAIRETYDGSRYYDHNLTEITKSVGISEEANAEGNLRSHSAYNGL